VVNGETAATPISAYSPATVYVKLRSEGYSSISVDGAPWRSARGGIQPRGGAEELEYQRDSALGAVDELRKKKPGNCSPPTQAAQTRGFGHRDLSLDALNGIGVIRRQGRKTTMHSHAHTHRWRWERSKG